MPPRPTPSSRKIITAKSTKDSKSKSTRLASGNNATNQANQILKNRTVMSTPRSDMIQEIGLQRSFPSTYSTEDYGQIEDLPLISSVTEDKFNDLMRKKLQQCRIICNFSDPMSDLKNRKIKLGYLHEILDCISQPKYFKLFEPETFKMFFAMIKSNIIRAISPIPDLVKIPMIGDDIKDTIYESTWPHLEVVYQIFQRFLESSLMDPSQFVQYIDSSFISQFLLLFNAADQRERDALKMILHRLYHKFIQQRPLIRQAITNVFYTYIYETRYFCGITELLEIMVSIIKGYAIPLKQEHKTFLIKILLPLHTSYYLHLFAPNLFFCVMQYIQKDSTLIPIIIKELLKLWPVSCSYKELLFINQLGKILEMANEEQFVELIDPLFHQIGKSITSNNFQVSEAAMLMWKNDKFVQLTTLHAKEIFPIICPYLYQAGTNHWNTGIKNLAVSVIRICMETSQAVFNAFSKTMKAQEQHEMQKLINKKETWKMMIRSAAQHGVKTVINEKCGTLDVTYNN
ncbi:serine/threonine-protein phosphatase 2A 56 kDa regulatory subunit alpha isoform [Histomonas meleagridis]|uniref:serine/threonine-protein phosphatase 2A 56 kDa regulatory subunit alpha isoform n=1 Tax=Histomonas meleagridis TaxID=135588 RepID=UPI003559CD2B|nr:serine/threonine-protein phosphatase 2A 56 kDa regulatory subunit alpha isoform [Histomonas meleagridis]KAH0801517.1 serine/threonine-protein phosphatase 2A 56 kDa regulatory subunit alpha isoform [Histomonas meleagridis]